MMKWHKSTFSAAGDCVEVTSSDTEFLVRDSKNPTGARLMFTRDEWAAFVAGVKDGQFDV